MGGRIGETIEFYYLDTEPSLKIIIESGRAMRSTSCPTTSIPPEHAGDDEQGGDCHWRGDRIGAAIASALSQHGLAVAIVGRRAGPLEQVRERLGEQCPAGGGRRRRAARRQS